MSRVNEIYFSKQSFEAGEMDNFIHNLAKMSYGEGEYRFEILIKPDDCSAYTVEYAQLPWDHSFGGEFKYVDEDEIIMIEKIFPDNHVEYFESEDEYKESFNNWITENKYHKNSYGIWVKDDEQR